jgi:V/A-type H+-transporting ATPase subunit F
MTVATSPESRAPSAQTSGAESHRVLVAVRKGDGLGFRLAGATVEEVRPGEEAVAFRRILADARVGLVAIEEELLAALPPRLVRRAHERGLPVLLPFALPRTWGDAGRGSAYVAALIRRAVGYAVKLGGRGGTS